MLYRESLSDIGQYVHDTGTLYCIVLYSLQLQENVIELKMSLLSTGTYKEMVDCYIPKF